MNLPKDVLEAIERAAQEGRVTEGGKAVIPGDLVGPGLGMLGMPQVSQAPLPDGISEEEFRRLVVQLAETLGWACYHTHDSRKSDEGFPDQVFVRERVVYAELKKTGGKLSAKQKRWLSLLNNAGEETYLWYPQDWTAIVGVLGRSGKLCPSKLLG